jgi:hypothetical protein
MIYRTKKYSIQKRNNFQLTVQGKISKFSKKIENKNFMFYTVTKNRKELKDTRTPEA